MSYYKIVKDGVVVEAGELFLRWQEKNRILVACPLEDAQFVASHDGETVYRVPWLNPAPAEAGSYEVVEAAVIDRQEYLDLRAVLDEGETPAEPDPIQPEPDPEPDPGPDQPEPEQPMTVKQMRAKIVELEQELSGLRTQLADSSTSVASVEEQLDMLLSGGD